MSKFDQPLPPIEDYPSPDLVDIAYEFEIQPGYVFDNGGVNTAYAAVVEAPAVEYAPPEVTNIDPDTTTLAWLEFYQRAVVYMKHPVRFDGDEPGPHNWVTGDKDADEAIRGERFVAAAPLLVTGKTNSGLEVATVGEVVDQGEVSPFMLRWLERFSKPSNARDFHGFLLPILTILEPALAETIKRNKYTENSLLQA